MVSADSGGSQVHGLGRTNSSNWEGVTLGFSTSVFACSLCDGYSGARP